MSFFKKVFTTAGFLLATSATQANSSALYQELEELGIQTPQENCVDSAEIQTTKNTAASIFNKIFREISIVPQGLRVVEDLKKDNTTICLHSLGGASGGYLEEYQGTIIVNAQNVQDGSYILLHEWKHKKQADRGLKFASKYFYNPSDAIKHDRFIEADSEAFATSVLHGLYELQPLQYNHLLNSPIFLAYKEQIEITPNDSSQAYEKAFNIAVSSVDPRYDEKTIWTFENIIPVVSSEIGTCSLSPTKLKNFLNNGVNGSFLGDVSIIELPLEISPKKERRLNNINEALEQRSVDIKNGTITLTSKTDCASLPFGIPSPI